MSASFDRFSVPSGCSTSAPKNSATEASTSCPGSMISRAMASASTSLAPLLTSRADTVLLPEAIPPVKPIIMFSPHNSFSIPMAINKSAGSSEARFIQELPENRKPV
ncbi:hypothetical protein D3C71_1664220 [compost metagenome]